MDRNIRVCYNCGEEFIQSFPTKGKTYCPTCLEYNDINTEVENGSI